VVYHTVWYLFDDQANYDIEVVHSRYLGTFLPTPAVNIPVLGGARDARSLLDTWKLGQVQYKC
jgi:hypothetical protein